MFPRDSSQLYLQIANRSSFFFCFLTRVAQRAKLHILLSAGVHITEDTKKIRKYKAVLNFYTKDLSQLRRKAIRFFSSTGSRSPSVLATAGDNTTCGSSFGFIDVNWTKRTRQEQLQLDCLVPPYFPICPG